MNQIDLNIIIMLKYVDNVKICWFNYYFYKYESNWFKHYLTQTVLYLSIEFLKDKLCNNLPTKKT